MSVPHGVAQDRLDAQTADLTDLLDHRMSEAERAMDRLRDKFGDDAVIKGLALDKEDSP